MRSRIILFLNNFLKSIEADSSTRKFKRVFSKAGTEEMRPFLNNKLSRMCLKWNNLHFLTMRNAFWVPLWTDAVGKRMKLQ